MSIDAEAIEKIAELATPKTFDLSDRTVSTAPFHNMPLPDEPRYPTVNLCTLGGLVKFVADDQKLEPPADAMILIPSPTNVLFVGPPMGVRRERDVYAKVTIAPQPFHFGQYSDLEMFRVELLTRFEETPGRVAILNFISKINDEAIRTLTDSGVSQTVTAKVGVASFGNVEVPSPVVLAPIRTFTEIDQPEGTFIFRMRKGGAGAGPEAALFEVYTDWQRTAVERIRAYLELFDQLSGVAIYA